MKRKLYNVIKKKPETSFISANYWGKRDYVKDKVVIGVKMFHSVHFKTTVLSFCLASHALQTKLSFGKFKYMGSQKKKSWRKKCIR